jgi:hypothetical protein
MALLLIAGGGTFSVTSLSHPQQAQSVRAAAAVNDLQILDKNEQAMQQMDQLLDDDAPADNSTAPSPQS